jgi:threonyl-tRNA synthetase
MSDSKHNLDELRHTLAHLLARAVLEHYPKAKPTLGPPVDNGFYYDFDFGGAEFSESELEKIEGTMKKLLDDWQLFRSYDVTANEAREFFADNKYKLELIDEIDEAGDDITLYYSGPQADAPEKADLLESDDTIFRSGFVDLCRGGHVDTPNEDISADSFTLDTVAGAYWRGNENNEMLTRIYGLAFASGDKLEEFTDKREKAKKRDHRKLGKKLGLFTFSEDIGSGLPLFTPRGQAMRDAITEKIDKIQAPYDYNKVRIPHLAKPALYKKSGHWEKFGEELFHVQGLDRDFVMKPMNCPHHTQIYDSDVRSYRDLPVRFVENTMVYRDEQSGELSGLSRVRSITQDDGHIFCTPDQIDTEIDKLAEITEEFYSSLGMWSDETFWVSLSVRDPDSPEDYLGADENWEKAENALENVATKRGLTLEKIAGEAAFYGPKIDFMFYDALDRERQLATIQLDFVMPDRFNLTYTAESGNKETPVMIHRAITGSLERFMSVVIEHFAGDFPFWLAPTQISLLPVGDEHVEYVESIQDRLTQADLRSTVLLPNKSVGKRIKKTHEMKVPYFAVIGDQETTSGGIELEARRDEMENIESSQDSITDDLETLR